MKFKFVAKDKISHLPKSPGVYAFKKGVKLLYIGKSGNLKERVKNHFPSRTEGERRSQKQVSSPVSHSARRTNVLRTLSPAFRDNLFINQIEKIGFIKSDSEIEALILEANLIKKYQPKFNVVWRDDKNYFYVGITKEDFPRVLITHQPQPVSRILYPVSGIKSKKIRNTKYKIQDTKFVGPFVEGTSLKKTLRVLRKIFPYYTVKKHPKNLCLWCHLGYCPGPNPDKKEYQKNIANLIAVLKGKRTNILKKLKKEMKIASDVRDFEKAAKIRDQIQALDKVLSHAKIFESPSSIPDWIFVQNILQQILKTERKISRIEAYDVSNIQGQQATGSMVTFINGQSDKNFYRRFKIKIAGKPNDIAMLKEILSRRFQHQEWGWPDLILIDGGIAQLKAALEVKNQPRVLIKPTSGVGYGKTILALALAKKENKLYIEGKKKPVLLKKLPREIFYLILQLRDEAHRFALSYHRKLREKF